VIKANGQKPRKNDDWKNCTRPEQEYLAVDDYIMHNINYLRVIFGIRLPPHG
jgi:hypothetical protein